ncbi:MAG: hypothetical protein K2X74_03605 [Acetobacteraceae bacterium]|nr:hypothetical protein [Acetobacteraceae bacterium]
MPVFMEIDGIKGTMRDDTVRNQAEAPRPDVLAVEDTRAAYEVKLEPVLVSSYQSGGHAESGEQIEIDSFTWGSTTRAGTGDPPPDAHEGLVAVPDTIEAADWILVSRLDGVDGASGPEIDWDVTAEPGAAVADDRGFVIFEYGVPG